MFATITPQTAPTNEGVSRGVTGVVSTRVAGAGSIDGGCSGSDLVTGVVAAAGSSSGVVIKAAEGGLSAQSEGCSRAERREYQTHSQEQLK